MVFIAALLALIGASLHALEGPLHKEVIKSKERLAQLHESRIDLQQAQVQFMEMRSDLSEQAAEISAQEQQLTAGREKLEAARADLQSKWLIPAGLRASLHAAFNLQAQLIQKLSAVMQRSKRSITHTRETLPALEQTVGELYDETGKLEKQGNAFVAKFDRPLQRLITGKPVRRLLRKMPSL